MPRQKKPGYYHHKPTDRAYTRIYIEGKRTTVYLGRYDSEEAIRNHHEIVLQFLQQQDASPASSLTVGDLGSLYLAHCKQRFRSRNGRQTSEYDGTKATLKRLEELFRDLSVEQFGRRQMKGLLNHLLSLDYHRATINQHLGRVRRMFDWGVEEELVSDVIPGAIRTVKSLNFNRGGKESKPVKPVDLQHVNAIRPFVSGTIWNAIKVQLFSGARPTEVLMMRPMDIDRSGETWLYRPVEHKAQYKGKDRVIPLGAKAQHVLEPLIAAKAADQFLFSPKDAGGMTLRPDLVRDHYDSASYRRAILRACTRAGVPAWKPNQLRHTFATEVRKKFGLEAAQVSLGHSSADITQVYAERDLHLALRVADEIG